MQACSQTHTDCVFRSMKFCAEGPTCVKLMWAYCLFHCSRKLCHSILITHKRGFGICNSLPLLAVLKTCTPSKHDHGFISGFTSVLCFQKQIIRLAVSDLQRQRPGLPNTQKLCVQQVDVLRGRL